MRPVSSFTSTRLAARNASSGVVVGHAGTAPGDHREPAVPRRVPGDRRVDGATQRVRVPLHEGVVPLVHRALPERPLEHRVGGLALGHHHEPGGARVQPVHDALPLGSTEVAMVCPAASRPSSTVGPDQPGVGCAATPAGLSTTTMSASSCTIDSPGTGSGARAGVVGGAGSVTSSHSPAGTRSDLAAWRPATRTLPLVTRSAAVSRDSPNMRASAASSRSPSRPSGTATRRGMPVVTSGCPPPGAPSRLRRWVRATAARDLSGAVQPDSAGGQHHGEDAAAHDARVRHVEDRPVRQLDPVHDVAAERLRARAAAGRSGSRPRRRAAARASPPRAGCAAAARCAR